MPVDLKATWVYGWGGKNNRLNRRLERRARKRQTQREIEESR